MDKNFWDRVKERAYYNSINREIWHMSGSTSDDWNSAVLDERLQERIEQDAYFNYLKYGDDPVANWEKAKEETLDRIRFLAFHLHENNFNKNKDECWKEAEKIYIENF